jgi:hypothetical protein
MGLDCVQKKGNNKRKMMVPLERFKVLIILLINLVEIDISVVKGMCLKF